MSVLAVIPARGGSKGVPGKNLRTVGGRGLVARAVGAARAAASVDRVVVSTDDPAIAREAEASGAVVVLRPAALATDESASEEALLHALSVVGHDVDVLVFLQATSPFIDPVDVDAAVARVRAGAADAVFAAIATPVFLWAPSATDGAGAEPGWSGVNHDAARRPRRQELPPQVAETGSFYVMGARGFVDAATGSSGASSRSSWLSAGPSTSTPRSSCFSPTPSRASSKEDARERHDRRAARGPRTPPVAGTAERLAASSAIDGTFVQLLANPALPSEPQRRAALDRSRWRSRDLAVLGLDDLVEQVRARRPEAVLVGMRGPTAAVVLRELSALPERPVLVTGLPGVAIPATRKALYYRAQADLMLVHSHGERRAFAARARELGWQHRFALSTLPFLERRPAEGDDIAFAAQALVPATLEERRWLVRRLDELARRHPHRRLVLKVRASAGEQQTHTERWPLPDLLDELPGRAASLVVRGGSMSGALDSAGGLVTVSSTAIIEAVARGIPALALDDFGVSDALINTVFRGSGLLGSVDEAIAGGFRMPDAAWSAENYLHHAADDDAATALASLVSDRATGGLPPRRAVRSTLGGPLRRAWDRKTALGPHDRSLSGAAALVIGSPARAIVRRAARVRGALVR